MNSIARQKILHHSIPHIPKYGWTRHSVVASCNTLGYPESMNGLVHNVPFDLVDYYQRWLIEQTRLTLDKDRLSTSRFYDNLKHVMDKRLTILKPFQPVWAEAVNSMMLPSNIKESIALLDYISHEIAILSGDNSYNMKWYVRRASITSICGLSELFMIQDRSNDFEDTFEFVQMRIEEAKQVELGASNAEQYGRAVGNAIMSMIPPIRV